MSSNTYSNPRLYIGDTELTSFNTITYSDSGRNQAARLTVTGDDPHINNFSLHNKEVKFFLNYGSNDTVPFFRGRIRQFTPTDKSYSIVAYDVRTFLTGKESLPIKLTDTDNYDGYTLGQFLYSYIEEYINVNETIIGLDLLNDTNPTVSLTNTRTSDTNALELITSKLPKDSTTSDIRTHRLTVIDDGVKSNICFVKEQSINDVGVNFSYSNGIKSLSVRKRPSPNLLSTSVNNTSVLYKHNNLNSGITASKIEGEFEYPDEATQEAFIQASLAENNAEINLNATKGHYLNIGNVISIRTPDYPEFNGKHRIVSKTVSCSRSGVNCDLQLSKESPLISDYLRN
tara:strand:- start:92 stop:1123 length:1032 start_codon:yes stop_codon:yes gene_type:complete